MKSKLYLTFIFFVLFISGCASIDHSASAQANLVRIVQSSQGVQITTEESVLFDLNKYDIKPEGQVYIQRVAIILKEKSKANILVNGHTDNTGSEKSNITLSINRANAVKNCLVQAGVDPKRIVTKGLGMSLPVADNSTIEGRQFNRRTEIVLIDENLDKIGGYSLAAKLQDGLANFFKDTSSKIKELIPTS